MSRRLVWSADELAGGIARCVLLSRSSFTGEESDIAHTGTSWITWLLTPRGDKCRIFHRDNPRAADGQLPRFPDG